MTLKQRIGRVILKWVPVTRFLFEQFRLEADALITKVANAIVPSRRAAFQRIRTATNLRANIACGPFPLPGFVNLDLFSRSHDDVLCYDCRRSLPFATNSVRAIRVEHFVEHLETREELPAFLRDCWRSLAYGGVLRVVVPDAQRFLEAYCRPDLTGFVELSFPEPFPSDLPTRMDIISHVFHQGHEHRWGYDFENLAHRLKQARFREITKTSFRHGVLDPTLAADDREVHAPYSLYIEALK
jgi:predicted SAM-dependent methyltransferase